MFKILAWAFHRVTQTNTVVAEYEEQIRLLSEQLQQYEQLQRYEQGTVEPNYLKKTGRVTIVRRDYFVIDQMYSVPNDMLKGCIGSESIEENTPITFLAYRQLDETSGERTIKVAKIVSVGDEKGPARRVAPNAARGVAEKHTKPAAGSNGTICTREEQGFVVGEKNNVITVETLGNDVISVDMNKTHTSFVPVVGDYVTLETRGEEQRVTAIEPFRSNGTGHILSVTPDGGTIFAFNRTYAYTSECLADAYRPSVNDTVEFLAIENVRVEFRFLSVKLSVAGVHKAGGTLEKSPISRTPTVGQRAQKEVREEGAERSQDKPISIVGDFKVTLLSSDETVERTIILKNESRTPQMIREIKGPKGNSLVTLKRPTTLAQCFLLPGETLEYVFSITGGTFTGQHHEEWVWMVAGRISIKRKFIITIGDVPETVVGPADMQSSRPVFDAKTREMQQKQAALSVLREHQQARIVPGTAKNKRPNFVAFSYPAFNVPPELFDLVLTTHDNGELMHSLCGTPYCLGQPLTADTYINRFRHCIFLEEIRQCIEFRQHDIERADFLREDNFLALHVPNIMEARPAILAGNVINVTATERQEGEQRPVVFQGVIHKVLQHRLLVKFDYNFQTSYKGESYRITFSYARGSYRKMQHAIGRVKLIFGMEYLFPETVARREPYLNVRLNERDELMLRDGSRKQGGRLLPWQNPNLNRYQKAAIVNVLRGEARPQPYVIVGPPGTGKTITTVELIHQLVLNAPDCRLIVATPSNSAADLITERLTSVLSARDFIRLVGANQVERDLIPPHLTEHYAMVDIAEDGTSMGGEPVAEPRLRKFQAKHIKERRVTISTCSTVGMLMRMSFPRNHFTHIIIDEAGQSVEPETLMPLALINRNIGSVTLVGDPQQLGPTVQSNEARGFGYDISLMERLLNSALPYAIDLSRFPDTHGYDPRLVTKLCINYRTIPSVLAVYSDLFYDSQLVPMQTNTVEDSELLTTLHGILEVKRPTADYGFFFCGINGINKQTPESPSWFNPLEASMVQKIVEVLYRKGYKPEELGIVTPYVMQVRLIRKQLSFASLESPKVGSVEEFQGQERRIMIVSMVRSCTSQLMYDRRAVLAFISSPKRINVAISRAKVAVIVVGNPNLLAFDETWLQILRRAVDNGTYVGCTLSETLLEAIQTGTPLKLKPYIQKTSGA
uniref:RNA helicase n=1 Tax=Anopheles atroparvus TaxID=41427 RepID=A0A182JB91_ANOAO